MRRHLTSFVLGSALALVACGPRRPAVRANHQLCAGSLVAIVTNNLDQSVDIKTSESTMLGSVGGRERREFVLPKDARGVFPSASPGGFASAQLDRIIIRYECR